MQLPAPEDSAAIQLTVARINDAIINGRLDLKKATALYYGLQIAALFIDRKRYFPATKTVQSAERTAGGGELAPANFVCGDDDDCNECPYTKICTQWHYVNEKEDGGGSAIEDGENDEDEDEGVDDAEGEDSSESEAGSNEDGAGSDQSKDGEDSDEDDEEEDGLDNQTTEELIADHKFVQSIKQALDKGDMQLAERLLA